MDTFRLEHILIEIKQDLLEHSEADEEILDMFIERVVEFIDNEPDYLEY